MHPCPTREWWKHIECGLEHDQELPCVTKCVNCNRNDHESDSSDCPAFREAKTVLKTSTIENISVKDARARFEALYSSRSKAPIQSSTIKREQARVSVCPAGADSQDIVKLRAEVAALQVSIKTVNEVTIPAI